MAERGTKEPPSVILKFRYTPERAQILQLIADAEHAGNISRLLRDLADEKIATRLRRPSSAAA